MFPWHQQLVTSCWIWKVDIGQLQNLTYMWNDLNGCCVKGETGTNKSAQALTQKNWKILLPPGMEPLATGSAACYYDSADTVTVSANKPHSFDKEDSWKNWSIHCQCHSVKTIKFRPSTQCIHNKTKFYTNYHKTCLPLCNAFMLLYVHGGEMA